ncbi:MAG: DUF305 domain-containing protein [Saccharospirillum sp.]|nr:DUF305 domain-containing protein [Saccharospirillum sp.]
MKIWQGLVVVVLGLFGTAMAQSDSLREQGVALKASLYEYEATGDANHDFANLISEQYRNAARLSEMKVDQLQAATLQRVARSAIAKVENELVEIETWKGRNSRPNVGENAELVIASIETLSERMKTVDARFVDADLEDDAYFAQLMLWHHEVAIAVGQLVVNQSVDAQARMLATDTVRRHTREIAQLRNWEVTN